MNKKYEKYMKKCFRLALKADGKTSPNPLVGCVILDKNENVVSTGYHKKCGMPHAEADALSKLQNNEAEGGTLIVNLEPCSHQGKTPPCADLIIKHKVKTVVIAMQDPNPIVSGRGIKTLEDAGINVIKNVLYDEAQKLNEVFVKNVTKNKCFVAIKVATTLDGKIATSNGDSKWITSEKARAEVQNIRNRYDAILTSSSTILSDNPLMTCRMKNSKNPIRIVLDRELKVPFSSAIYNNTGDKVVLVVAESLPETILCDVPRHVSIIKCKVNNLKVDLEDLLEKLYKIGIKSLLIEAGGKLNGDFLNKNLVDKIYQFIAPKIVGDSSAISAFEGRSIKKISNALNFKFESITDYSPDILLIYIRLV